MRQKAFPFNTVIIITRLITLFLFLPLSVRQANATDKHRTMNIENIRQTFFQYSPAEQGNIRSSFMPYVQQLKQEINNIPLYDKKKSGEIQQLKNALQHTYDLRKRWHITNKLFEAYSNVNCDSMFAYANLCSALAHKMNDKKLFAASSLNKAQAALQGGYFRESADYLHEIKVGNCDKALHIRYLKTAFNLEFEDGFYFPVHVFGNDIFDERMQSLYQQMTLLQPGESPDLYDMRIKMAFHRKHYEQAIAYTLILLNKLPYNSKEYAYAIGNLGYNYMGAKDFPHAMKYMTQSAILNIRRGSKEYPAIRKIAEILYATGDIDDAYCFINIALKNSVTFNSKYRNVEAMKMYPKINETLYEIINRKNDQMTGGIVLLSIISCLLIAAVFFVVKQKREIKTQNNIIEQQMNELKTKSEDMEAMNKRLKDASHIKDIILGQQITATATRMEIAEKLRTNVYRKLKIKDYAGIENILDRLKTNKAELFTQIDHLLLSIFPEFPSQFNALLKKEMRTIPAKPHGLTPEMRIFALIRLGITKNEDIAKCLNYSINTVKSYKTRIMNASNLPGDAFYHQLSLISFEKA